MSDLTWVEISKANFQHNLTSFRGLLGPGVDLLTVVKSNAYGHGLVEMGKLATEYGSDWLGVVNLDEALKLRLAGIKAPLLVLSFYPLEEVSVKAAIEQGISLVVYDFEQLEFLDKLAGELGEKARVHLKFDVGTTRLGVLADDEVVVDEFLTLAAKTENVEVEGVFSHLAASEEDEEFTRAQAKKFRWVVARAREVFGGEKKLITHLACSAAGMLSEDFQFDMARLGIAAYGLWPAEELREKMGPAVDLKPALAWKTKIIQIKTVSAGTNVGYGCSYKTKSEARIAVVPVGYWDGVDRHLSNCGEFLVKGRRCPIRGRVCMNLTMIDVTGIENLEVGETVTLIGKDGAEEVTADEWAGWIGTINYEVATRINPEIKRIYV